MYRLIQAACLGYFVIALNSPAQAGSSTNALGSAPAVDFSRPGGTFVDSFALTLSTASSEALIRYTLDGRLPTAASTIYSSPIPINSSVQVRAMTFVAGLPPGPPHSESYLALKSDVLSFSSDLPVVVIYNFKGGPVPVDPRQFANLSVFEPGSGRTSLTNAPTLSVRAGINLRGSSTLFQPKSNFRVELWDDADQGKNYPVLGMPADNDWVLYACDNFEPVLIHNPFMHDLSRQIGRYSPRNRFVEVYLNTTGGPVSHANYNGVYVLLEKIKQGKPRVDIDQLQPADLQPPELTGGYLMSVDRSNPGEGQIYGGGLGVNALDPKWDELVQSPRTVQLDYISSYLDAFDQALNAANFADPVSGYAQYVDVDSALDHHILNTLAFNVDALRLSAYFYKPRNGKLTFGPLWDFDRALGSTDGRDANPRVWRSPSGDQGTDMFNPAPNVFSNPWFSRMFRDLDFWQRWIDRWQELRRSQFALTNLYALVDSLAGQVREAERREVARWPGFTMPRGGSYQAEVDRMKTWLSNRIDFIDTNFLGAPVFGSPGGTVAVGASTRLSAPAGATIYYTLDGTDPRARGGAPAVEAKIYSGPLTLTRNVRLVARSWDSNHRNLTGPGKPPLSSPWSGSVAATYVVSLPTVAVSEIMYHPAPPPAGSPNSAEQFEFIELKNTGDQPVSLLGCQFAQGIAYLFTTNSSVTFLDPGEYLVLVKDRAAFGARYPNVKNIAGEYEGNLDNSGERIVFQGPLQETIAEFSYSPAWYPSTAGQGLSLVLADENGAPGDVSAATSWRPSSVLNGSPGGPDPAAPLTLRFVHLEDDTMDLQFQAAPGQSYSALKSDLAKPGAWQKLIDYPEQGSARLLKVTDPIAPGAMGRFYQIVSPAVP
jgi:hypothetical protein